MFQCHHRILLHRQQLSAQFGRPIWRHMLYSGNSILFDNSYLLVFATAQLCVGIDSSESSTSCLTIGIWKSGRHRLQSCQACSGRRHDTKKVTTQPLRFLSIGDIFRKKLHLDLKVRGSIPSRCNENYIRWIFKFRSWKKKWSVCDELDSHLIFLSLSLAHFCKFFLPSPLSLSLFVSPCLCVSLSHQEQSRT